MADQARTSSRNKVVRSQRVASTASPTSSSTADGRSEPGDDDSSENPDRVPAAVPTARSHTPGHLATKSQDRRRKPSELSIRQRSQSSAGTSSTSQLSVVLPPTSKTPGPGSVSRSQHASIEAITSNVPARERGDSSSTDRGSATAFRRPAVMRSTSAILSKPSSNGAPPSAPSRQPSNAGPRVRGGSSPFPPLADPQTAPDVLPAPSSGMYWSRAPMSGCAHTALRAHTTTLIGSNVYIFGGCDSRACFNELYVLDADAFYWSRPHVAGDIPVPLRAMTCTAVGKKLVIFGGGDGPAYYNDIYILDTVNFRWTRPKLTGDQIPSKRRAHTACLYKNGIYVFGGGDGVRALNDIWRLDVSDVNKMSWKLVSGPSSDKPSSKDLRPKARGYHTANMVGSKLIIYGGSDGGECFSDVWVYDVERHYWRAVNIPLTFRRLSHTATIVGSYLFVIGGHDGNEYSNDLLLLNLVSMTWDRRRVYGMPPGGRGYHGVVLYDSRLLVIGGFDGNEVFDDVWILELAVHAYYSQISHFSIEV